MIYPSRQAILAAAAIAPAALVVGVIAPVWWYGGLALLVFLLVLIGIDALGGPRAADIEVECAGPASVGVGSEVELELHARIRGSAPRFVEVALSRDPLLEPLDGIRGRVPMGRAGSVLFRFLAVRRGFARIGQVWLRWPGPMGLVWRQTRLTIGQEIAITPDIRAVREKSAQMLHRDAGYGIAPQLQVGEGAEFESLTEYRPGMDRRTIDWKQSARHTALIAKEYRTERNNNIVLALDSGRAMTEPLAGVPRIDRAVAAALLAAYVALKDGDRVGLFGFDSHPRLSSKPLSGPRSFALLQRLAAGIDYSARETNYTLGLATLAAGLRRRSLIIIFTDFADTISAELMLGAVGALLKRHLVLFVVLRDEELERFAEAEPREPADVTRAVTASALLRQRRLVVTKLRHLGVHVIEAAHEEAGPSLVNAYLAMKRRSML